MSFPGSGGAGSGSSLYPPQQTGLDPTGGWAQKIAGDMGLTLPSSDVANSPQYTGVLGATNKQMLSVPVFTGWGSTIPGEPHRPQAQFTTIADLLNQFYQMNPSQVNKLGQKLAAAGQMDPNAVGDPAATEQAYSGVLSQLAKMTGAQNYVTFDDYLSTYLKQVNANKPATYTNTATQTNITDPQSARQMLVKTLQDSLGRDPTASEYQAFLSSIHAAERANPTVSKTTYKLNSRGTYDVANQTSSGGVDPSSFASEYGQTHNQHEHAAVQAATTYFDALRQAVGAVV